MFSNKIASGEFCPFHFADQSDSVHMLDSSQGFKPPSEISLALMKTQSYSPKNGAVQRAWCDQPAAGKQEDQLLQQFKISLH